MRQRHALYLSEAMTQQLQLTAETHRVSKSEILERALRHYLAPSDGSPSIGVQVISQEKNARSLSRLERDLAIVTELTATFVRYFVTITPPIPMSEREAAWALGEHRFNQVIEEVAKRLRTDRSLIARVMATIAIRDRQEGETMPLGASQRDTGHGTAAAESVSQDARKSNRDE